MTLNPILGSPSIARHRRKQRPLCLVVLGTLASDPFAGMAWMTMQVVAGLRLLGHDVYYMEVTSVWPYDPVRGEKVDDSAYAVPYLDRVARSFGLEGRWAYRRSYSDREWLGMDRRRAEDLLLQADAVFNIAGATRIRTKENLNVGRLVYFGTDPVYYEVKYAQGDRIAARTVNQHDDFVTYGENIGTAHSPVPPFPRLRSRTRQPVLLDLWAAGPPSRQEFTTVCNWKQEGHDMEFDGETYLWSKHHEFMRFIDLPLRTAQPIELAMSLVDSSGTRDRETLEMIPALGMTPGEHRLLHRNGWKLTDSQEFSTDPWLYRDYIRSSRAEFSVARDQNVRLCSGWFSERSACYLAAGRPVVTQDTGFGTVLPTGEGLFAFNTTEEAIAAVEAVNGDYARHSRAAREIASEHFAAEKVLRKVLEDLGL